ncbi:MAG: DUF1080 domain-containing protein [Prolixibacteraceae bacterium]
MKNNKRNLIAGMLLFVVTGTAFAQDKCFYEREGYVPLFNGKDLTGWKIPKGDNGHWSVVDGVIDYDARSEAEGLKDLWTGQSYTDFKLHIEWRFKGYGDLPYPVGIILPNGDYQRDENGEVIKTLQPNSDSGVYLKSWGQQTNLWCWPAGSGELWVVRNDKSLPPEVRAGAVPKENADKPVGQWNAFDITVLGKRVTIVNNGIVVIDNALYPGLEEKGPIGLQHHGGLDEKTGKLKKASSLVQFRNIWIKEL